MAYHYEKYWTEEYPQRIGSGLRLVHKKCKG